MNNFKDAEYSLCCPNEYYKHFIDKGIRPDDRTLTESREVKIGTDEILSSSGSCVVRIGNTLTICGIKPELVVLSECKDVDKFIIINFDYCPLIFCEEKYGSLTEQSQILTRYIEEIWERHPLISDDSLIINDMVRWVLYVDIVCITRDGAELDSAYIALCSAFKSLKLPDIEIREDVYVHGTTQPVPYNHHNNCSYTFCYFGNHWIIDPTEFETEVSDGLVHLIYDGQSVNWIRFSGLSERVTFDCLEQLFQIVAKAHNKIKTT